MQTVLENLIEVISLVYIEIHKDNFFSKAGKVYGVLLFSGCLWKSKDWVKGICNSKDSILICGY